MHPSLEHLQKILKNEISLGYANKSIIGGLPKMLGFWEPNARRNGLDPALIETIAARLRAYPDLPMGERPAAMEALLALVAEADARLPQAASRPAAAPRTAAHLAPARSPAP